MEPKSSTAAQPPAMPSLLTRAHRRARREILRSTRNPFPSRDSRTLLVHCGHHKSGTVWFRQVFFSVIRPYGLRQQEGRSAPIRPATDFAFYANAATFRRQQIGDRPFRGSHLIRDPRDLVVSGYEYHLVTQEPWTQRPWYQGLSYQAYLQSLSEHDGLMAEIEWMAVGTAADMARWDYHQPEFLELRYEDAFADERGTFEKLFGWYGLNDRATAGALEAVDRLSLKRGGGALPNHARSGDPGEWRRRLSPEHIARFKELTGDLTVRLGYETDPDW
jgi:hypothetical protein